MAAKNRTVRINGSLAVLKTHVEYIKDSIDKIDEKVTDHISWTEKKMESTECAMRKIETRIQKLEDWENNCQTFADQGLKKWHFKVALAGLIISTGISIFVIALEVSGLI